MTATYDEWKTTDPSDLTERGWCEIHGCSIPCDSCLDDFYDRRAQDRKEADGLRREDRQGEERG